MQKFLRDTYCIEIVNQDAITLYERLASPIVIVSDGPYGIGGFPGDPPTYEELAEWYEPHIQYWSKKSTPQTTLWFWNTEIGWATVHPILERYGWEYRACNIWNKGIGHIAGNSNTQKLRMLPIVTEVCVQYIKKPYFLGETGRHLTMQEWLRCEWSRTGLPFSKANEACGVKNAATRKYFTKDYLWYFPPPEAFGKFVKYANQYGRPEGVPYFSLDGEKSLTEREWEALRAKFYCPVGVTNVWDEPPVNGRERLKKGTKALHLNQKPLKLMELIISISSDAGDLIWEPFGGLCSASMAAMNLGRNAVAAEINPEIYKQAVKRLEQNHKTPKLL